MQHGVKTVTTVIVLLLLWEVRVVSDFWNSELAGSSAAWGAVTGLEIRRSSVQLLYQCSGGFRIGTGHSSWWGYGGALRDWGKLRWTSLGIQRGRKSSFITGDVETWLLRQRSEKVSRFMCANSLVQKDDTEKSEGEMSVDNWTGLCSILEMETWDFKSIQWLSFLLLVSSLPCLKTH